MTKIITNPTDKDIKVTFESVDYSVKADSSVSVPNDIAIKWLKIHEFLFVSEEVVKEKKVEKKEVKKEVVKEEVKKTK